MCMLSTVAVGSVNPEDGLSHNGIGHGDGPGDHHEDSLESWLRCSWRNMALIMILEMDLILVWWFWWWRLWLWSHLVIDHNGYRNSYAGNDDTDVDHDWTYILKAKRFLEFASQHKKLCQKSISI